MILASETLSSTCRRYTPAKVFLYAIGFILLAAPAFAADMNDMVEAAKKEGALVYWGTDAETAPKFVKKFEERYPFMKGKITFYDAPTNEVVERLLTEAKAGRHSADFISISEDFMPTLNTAGLLFKHDWSAARQWGAHYQPDHGMWVNVGINPRPAIYNTEIINPNEAPKNYEGLINEKWKGKSAISTVAEELPFVLAYFWGDKTNLNWKKSFSFFERLVDVTKPAVVKGFTGPTRLLAAGEIGIMHTAIFSRAHQMIKRKAPVGIVPLNPMYGSARAFGILKNAPHPHSAKLFAHWMTSTEGTVEYANLMGTFPLDPQAGDAEPVKAASKFGITRDLIKMVPTELWTKDNQKKSADFYYKLLGLK